LSLCLNRGAVFGHRGHDSGGPEHPLDRAGHSNQLARATALGRPV